MKKTLKLTSIIIILLLIAGFVPAIRVSADIAPDPRVPGNGISVIGSETMVQMVYEEVRIKLLEGSLRDPDISESAFSPDSHAIITAHFEMKNQGSQAERIHVGFPMDGTNYYSQITNVSIKINHKVIEFEEEEIQAPTNDYFIWLINWVTFDVDFPAGETVEIDVQYEVPAVYRDPLDEYEYLLETGAGWYGKIGEGVIVFELPYEATPGNTYVAGLKSAGVFPEYSGNEVQWTFYNLEPQGNDNIRIRTVKPNLWQQLLADEAALVNDPSNCDAILALGDEYFYLSHIYNYTPRTDYGGIDLYQRGLVRYRSYLDYCSVSKAGLKQMMDTLCYFDDGLSGVLYLLPQDIKEMIREVYDRYVENRWSSNDTMDDCSLAIEMTPNWEETQIATQTEGYIWLQSLMYQTEMMQTDIAYSTELAQTDIARETGVVAFTPTHTVRVATRTPQPVPENLDDAEAQVMEKTRTEPPLPPEIISGTQTPEQTGSSIGWLAIPALLLVGGIGFLYLRKKQP